MKNKIIKLWNNLYEHILTTEGFKYLVVGGLTTFLNMFTFLGLKILFENMKMPNGWIVAECIAFVIAVLFAFFCDKFIVFKIGFNSLKRTFSELISFISMRIVSEIVNILIMGLLINILNVDAFLSKVLVSVVVIIMNYIFSKFFIFKKDEK